jgi:hypothetical protein
MTTGHAPGAYLLEHFGCGGLHADSGEPELGRLTKGRGAALAAAMHLAAILRAADAFEQSPERDVERRVLVGAVSLSTDHGAFADQRELHAIGTGVAVRLVMTTQLHVEGKGPFGQIRDLLGLLGRVSAEPIRDPQVSSDDVQFHDDLRPPACHPVLKGGSTTPVLPP